MRIKSTIVLLSVVMIAMVMATSLNAAPAAPIPGLTAADEHPKGCVDCHQNLGAGKDYRITTGLAGIKGVKHPDISKMVKNVPTDCFMCHKTGSKTPALSIVLHKAHFADPASNPFVTFYQGACLNCHKLTPATGVIGLKAAPANW